MAKIKVKDLEAGMVLTADVCDQNGRFLLGEGVELTDKHIKVLNAWGVISVEISGEQMPESDSLNEVSPEVVKSIEDDVKSRFVHNDLEQPFIRELVSESIRFFIEQKRN